MNKINCLLILMLAGLLSSCNKVRTYRINIENQTGFKINELAVDGASLYKHAIGKDSATGETIIEWKGPRVYLDGEYCFYFYVYSFSDKDSTYVDESPCGSCIGVKNLSEKKLNLLTLKYVSNSMSSCTYDFDIEQKK